MSTFPTLTISDRQVPMLGMGTWHMGDDTATADAEIAALRTGLDEGLSVIDTAEMYGNGNSETLVGRVLPHYDRDQVYLISKFIPAHASPSQVRESLDASLKRLGTDYLDLYLYHWPSNYPLEATVEALEAAKAAGKIRAWGVSNFDVEDMTALLNTQSGQAAQSGQDTQSGQAVAANEILYNLGERGPEFDLMPWLDSHHIPTIAYTPIAQGDTLGRDLTHSDVVRDIASSHHTGVFQVLLAWTIRSTHVLAIPQSSNPDHVRANLDALTFTLSDDELRRIDRAYPAPTHPAPLAMI